MIYGGVLRNYPRERLRQGLIQNLLKVSKQIKRKFCRHRELIKGSTQNPPCETPISDRAGRPGRSLSRTFDRRADAALPVVPQVHRTFFNFAKDFKATLQLRARAVGPQTPHVHDPSLLLLVKRGDRHESRRLKVEVCCFSSPSLNEKVLITPLHSGERSFLSPLRLSPSGVPAGIGSACFLLSDKVANRTPPQSASATQPPPLPLLLLPTHQPERFLSNDVFKFGASAKNGDADGRRQQKSFQPSSRSILLIPGYSFPREAASHRAGKPGFPEPQRTSGSSRYNSGTNRVGQQLQLLSNLIASANHITQKKPGAKVPRCYLFIHSLVCHYWRESAEARRSARSGGHGCKSVACR